MVQHALPGDIWPYKSNHFLFYANELLGFVAFCTALLYCAACTCDVLWSAVARRFNHELFAMQLVVSYLMLYTNNQQILQLLQA